MIRISQIKLNIDKDSSYLKNYVCSKYHINDKDINDFKISKKSLDARDKSNIRYVYTVDVEVKNEKIFLSKNKNKNITSCEPVVYRLPEPGDKTLKLRPVVVGCGPAGLFCALMLSRYGFSPILIEQGEDVDSRQKTIDSFLTGENPVNKYSNVQFGEGGAGTFSDGKLTSGVKDVNGRKSLFLETFAACGASEEILYNAKPHVGTDLLKTVVRNIRNEIIKNGGEVWFNSCFDGFKTIDGRIKSVHISKNGESISLECDDLVLAIGHSARDTVKMLYADGINMEAKSFAVGVRAEHLQEDINKAQYGDDYKKKYGQLPAADYKLITHNSDGHSVYSFCMCPGGYVINSSSEPGLLCVNGMSYSARDGVNANSAIVVNVDPKDTGADTDVLAGIEFQRILERAAFDEGGGLIPVQRLKDFNDGRVTEEFGNVQPQTKGLTQKADLNKVLPEFISRNIKEAMKGFGQMIRGYDNPDAVLSAVESRTSSPVRIVRDENFESNIRGIYPCGEGAGYAGGITSAAIDGIKVFEAIYKQYKL